MEGSRGLLPHVFPESKKSSSDTITDECACFTIASPAKFSFVIKKTINLKHKIHSSNYLPNTYR